MEERFIPVRTAKTQFTAAKLSSGVTFTWAIDANGLSKPVGTAVGLASNQFENFQVFKGNGIKLVENEDGVELFIIYTVN